MKKYLLLLLAVALAACARNQNTAMDTVTVIDNLVIDEHSVPIFPKKAALTTDTARRFAIDLPKRCSVDWGNQRLVSVLPEEEITMVQVDAGDALPEFAVEDFAFSKITVKAALEKLLAGTKITVVEEDAFTDKVSGEIGAGTLTDAVTLIASLGRAYYSYDDDAKTITLSSRAKWLIKMPRDQYVIMALLDAMHGEDIRNLIVNWSDKTVIAEGNHQTQREIQNIIADISAKKYLLVWDTDVYRVYPRTDNPIVWMNMLPAFGEQNVKMSVPGVVGRMLVTSPEVNTRTLQEFLGGQGNVVLISQGSFVFPNGWQSRFDIGQCGREDRLETDLIIGASGKYGKFGDTNKIDSKIVLRTNGGEIASFNAPTSLGDNIVIIGIPTHTFVTTPETLISPFAELVVFMSPRLIEIGKGAATAAKPLSGNDLRKYLDE